MISFLENLIALSKGWTIISKLYKFYPPTLYLPVPPGADLILLIEHESEIGLNPVG